MWQPQNPGEAPLPVLDRLTPDVLTVHFQQVEHTKDSARVSAMAPDEIEHCEPIVVANNGLAIVPEYQLGVGGVAATFDSKENAATGHEAVLEIDLAGNGAPGAQGPTGEQGPAG